jgi:hypothetical protein
VADFAATFQKPILRALFEPVRRPCRAMIPPPGWEPRQHASSTVITPESTATTTAALRRTTHRFVFGGGKSSFTMRFSHL